MERGALPERNPGMRSLPAIASVASRRIAETSSALNVADSTVELPILFVVMYSTVSSKLVRRAGVEPAWNYPLDPRSSASASSATLAEYLLTSQGTESLDKLVVGRAGLEPVTA